MAAQSGEALLAELAGLTHDQRMVWMVEIGRHASADSDAAQLVAELEAGDTYQRVLALQACYGRSGGLPHGETGAHVQRALADPSRLIRKRAIGLAPLVCTDDQLLDTLRQSSPDVRRSLIGALARRRRRAPVDAYLETADAQADPDFDRLVPYGSAELVERFLDRAMEAAGDTDWRRLARHHPAIAAGALQRRVTESQEADPRLVWSVSAALPFLAGAVPDGAMALVSELARTTSLAYLDLQPLVLQRPAAVAAFALSSEDTLRVSLDSQAHRLSLDVIRQLLVRRPAALGDTARWLRRLRPPGRAALFDDVAEHLRQASGDSRTLPEWFLDMLPAARREAEARLAWDSPVLAGRPAQRLPYAAYLPWEETRTALDPFVRNPDPALRASAYAALGAAVRFQRERAADLLTFIHARRNEQDPVRQAMLTALADLPPSTWQAVHLEALGSVLRDALDASDLSRATEAAAERLVVQLLPLHPSWGASWLATLVRERGRINFFAIEHRLTDEDVRRLVPVLLPVLRSWLTRERVEHIVASASALGRRLRVFPELVTLLEQLVHESWSPHTSEAALAVIEREVPERFRALVPGLLDRDKTWATRRLVYKYLHRRRQDLLTPFLGRTALLDGTSSRGRFSTGKTRFVLPVVRGVFRWTSAQQATFAESLRALVHDAWRDVPAILRAIRQLEALAYIPPALLVRLASFQETEPPESAPASEETAAGSGEAGVDAATTAASAPQPSFTAPRLAARDAALRALGARDAGDGVPLLLEALNDERARIAIYALRQAVLELPPDRALTLLRDVPLDRVTVAKEVARLLGDLRSEAAVQELLAWSRRDLHRDVHVAVIRGLWFHVERDDTWEVLNRAATSSDAAVATAAGRLPAERLSPTGQRRLASLLALLLAHPDAAVRLDALNRCALLPIRDDERTLVRPLVEAISSPLPDESSMAAVGFFSTYARRDPEVVAATVTRLLPRRRALSTVVGTLESTLSSSHRLFRDVAERVLLVLETDPLTATLQVGLATAVYTGNALASWLTHFAARDLLHADALAIALEAIGPGAGDGFATSGWSAQVGTLSQFGNPAYAARRHVRAARRPRRHVTSWRDSSGRYAPVADRLLSGEIEAALTQSPDPRLRRLALGALVTQTNDGLGWTKERIARLHAFRNDPDPLVAGAAQFTILPASIEGGEAQSG